MNVEITEFEKRFCFELCPVTQLCGQNVRKKNYIFESLRRYFGTFKYSESKNKWRDNVFIDNNQVGRKFFSILSISNKIDIIQMIKMTKQSLLMEYVKNIIQDFDWQLHLRNLSEEIEIMFQIINDQVNKVGDIELSYSMSDVWDMVQKSEVSGIDDTELSDKSNAELILILLNIVDNVLKNNPKKTLILFENLDHLVSLKEYIEIIHAADTISKKYDLYFIFSSSLNKYVCCDIDFLEGVSVFGDVHFQMPEYNRLYLFLKENYPYEKEFSNEHVQKIICNIIQSIGQSNFLNTVEENVVCKLINQTLLLDDKIPTYATIFLLFGKLYFFKTVFLLILVLFIFTPLGMYSFFLFLKNTFLFNLFKSLFETQIKKSENEYVKKSQNV